MMNFRLFSNRKQLDPQNLTPDNISAIHSPFEAAELLRQSIDSKNNDYITISLNLVYRLSSEDDRTRMNNISLGEAGVCGLVDQLMGQKLTDIILCKSCLQVMYSLMGDQFQQSSVPTNITNGGLQSARQMFGALISVATNKSIADGSSATNISRFSSSGTLFRIIKAGTHHIQDLSIVVWCLRCILVFGKDGGLVAKLLACGLAEMLGNILGQYGGNQIVVTLCCQIIHFMVFEDVEELDSKNNCQDKFGERGICEILSVRSLSQVADFGVSPTGWILRAIGSLSRKNKDLKRRFALCGTCEMIAKECRRAEFLRDKSYAESLCWCIANITFPDEENQHNLGELGLCSTLTEILISHSGEINVIQEGLRAFRNLCHGCESNALFAEQTNAVPEIMKLFRAYSEHPEVLQWVMFCLCSLVPFSCLDNQLLHEQICPEMVSALQRYLVNRDFVEWSGSILLELGSKDVYVEQLRLHQCAPVLINALNAHVNDTSVMEEMLAAIGSMVEFSQQLRCSFIESHIIDSILKILAAHEGDENVVDQAYYVLANLIKLVEDVSDEQLNNKDYCVHSLRTDYIRVNHSDMKKYYKSCFDSIMFSSGFKLLSRVSSRYTSNVEIARNSSALFGGLLLCTFLALSTLPPVAKMYSVLRFNMFGVDSSLSVMGDSGMLNTLTTLVASHEQNQEVIQYSLIGVLQLCAIDRNIAALRSNGLCSVLPSLLAIHYIHCPHIVLLVFEVMTQMCADARSRELFARLCMKKDESLILAVLAHNLQNSDIVKSGCELLSALCVSPTDDALAVTSRESNELKQLTIAQPSLKESEESSKVGQISLKGESILEKFTSIIYNPSVGTPSESGDFGLLLLDTIGTTDNSATSNIFLDAANNFISTGLSDQDAKRIEQSLKTEEAKPIGDGLIDCGALSLLLGIVESHALEKELVVAVVNAINSLCIVSSRKLKFLESDVLKVLIDLLNKVKKSTIRVQEESDFVQGILRLIIVITLGTLCLPKVKSKLNESVPLQRIQSLMVSFGVVDLLFSILATNPEDALLSEVVLRTIFYVLDGNEEARSQFAQISVEGKNGAELIVSSMQFHASNFQVVYYASLSIYAVCLDKDDNCQLFGACRVSEVLLLGMKNFLSRPDVCESCCHAIFALKPLNQHLGQSDACSFTLQALTTHPANNRVAEWVCRAIGSLVENDRNKQHLDSLGVCRIITGALQRHVATDNIFSAFSKDTSSAGVAQWGCTAIYYLSKGLEGESFQNKLVEAGACEAVAKALVKYSEIESVAYCCCRALVVLLYNNDLWKNKLGSLGVCACIVESLHLYPSSAQVAKWGCRAVSVLAESNEQNIAKLASAGACETVPLLLQSHPNNEHVAGAGCDVISFMSEQLPNGLAARFGHAGACEAVVSVLQKHVDNPTVTARACVALAALARVQGNARWFGPTGACEALLSALIKHHDNQNVVKFVVSAIGNLCIVEHNRSRFGVIGICDKVVSTSTLHYRDRETAKACVTAIWKLCENSNKRSTSSSDLTNTKSNDTPAIITMIDKNELLGNPNFVCGNLNRAALFFSGVCEVVSKILKTHMADPSTAQATLHCISVLAYGTHSWMEREKFGDLDSCREVCAAIEWHSEQTKVLRWACVAIRSLSYRNPVNQMRLNQGNAPSLLANILKTQTNLVDTAGISPLLEAVLAAITNIAMDCSQNKSVLGLEGVCESILQLLEQHLRNPDFSFICLRALFFLCDKSEANCLTLSFSSAPEVLNNMAGRYIEDEQIILYICLIMVGIAADKVGQSRLGTMGACKLVIQLMMKFEKSSDSITLWCCTLVSALATGSTVNQDKLAQSGACKQLTTLIMRALNSFVTSKDKPSLPQTTVVAGMSRRPSMVVETGLVPPSTGDTADAGEKQEALEVNFEGSGRLEEPDKAMAMDTKQLIPVEAMKAIYHLCLENESNRQKMLSTGIVDLVTEIVSTGTASAEEYSTADLDTWAKKTLDILIGTTQF